jgi:MFS family permease
MSFFSAKLSNRIANKTSFDLNFLIILSITPIALLGLMSINPVLPTIATSFQISPEKIGLLMTAFLVPVAFGTPIFGVLIDRIGRKQILFPSLLVFALGGILSAFAQDFHSLLEWRFLQGVGAASLESLQLTLIADLYAGRSLTSAMALNTSVIGISATIFPLLGGALAQLGWRYPFLLSLLAIPLAVLVLTTLKLPEKKNSVDRLSVQTYLKNSLRSIKNRRVLGLMLAILSLFFLEFGIFFICVPILATKSLHASSATIGILLAFLEISLSAAASQLGFLVKRFSEITLIKIAFVICALSLAIIPGINNIWMLLFAIILFGAAQGISIPSIQTLLATSAPEEYRAAFMSLNITVQSLARALGPIVAGIGLGFVGMQNVLYISVGIALFTVVLLNPLLKSQKSKVRSQKLLKSEV